MSVLWYRVKGYFKFRDKVGINGVDEAWIIGGNTNRPYLTEGGRLKRTGVS